MSPLIVMKFGGTNMGHTAAIQHSASLVSRSLSEQNKQGEHARVVVVVSAMAGVTNQLLELADAAQAGKIAEANDELATIRTRHFSTATELGATPDSDTVRELRELLETLRQAIYGVYLLRELTPRSRDLIVAFGERLSAPLMSFTLSHSGFPAKHLTGGEAGIVTDTHFGHARPLPEADQRISDRLSGFLSADVTPVISGFMGETTRGVLTTLGRGGTDYSATIIGKALQADEVWAWKDVDGVMSADPRLVPEARNIETLSYGEVMELAYFGAKVLHPLAVTPLEESSIPLRVKSAADPHFAGTLVQKYPDNDDTTPVKAVTAIRQVSLIDISGAGVFGTPDVITEVLNALAKENITILMISQSSSMSNLSLVVLSHMAERTLQAVSKIQNVEASEQANVAVLAIVGSGMRGTKGVSARLFAALAEAEVNVLMISQGSSELNISVVIDEDTVDEATRAVHTAFQLGQQ